MRHRVKGKGNELGLAKNFPLSKSNNIINSLITTSILKILAGGKQANVGDNQLGQQHYQTTWLLVCSVLNQIRILSTASTAGTHISYENASSFSHHKRMALARVNNPNFLPLKVVMISRNSLESDYSCKLPKSTEKNALLFLWAFKTVSNRIRVVEEVENAKMKRFYVEVG